MTNNLTQEKRRIPKNISKKVKKSYKEQRLGELLGFKIKYKFHVFSGTGKFVSLSSSKLMILFIPEVSVRMEIIASLCMGNIFEVVNMVVYNVKWMNNYYVM